MYHRQHVQFIITLPHPYQKYPNPNISYQILSEVLLRGMLLQIIEV